MKRRTGREGGGGKLEGREAKESIGGRDGEENRGGWGQGWAESLKGRGRRVKRGKNDGCARQERVKRMTGGGKSRGSKAMG